MLLFFDWKVTPYHLPMRSSSLVGGLRESHVLYKILLGSRSLSSTSISSTISWSPSSALSTSLSLSLSSVSTGNNRLGGYFSLICAESMIIFGLPPSTLHLILLHTDFIPWKHVWHSSSLKQHTFLLCKHNLPCTEGMRFLFLDRLLFLYCCMLFLLFDLLHCLYHFICLHGAILLCNSDILFGQFGFYLLDSQEIGYFRKNNTFLVQFIDDCNGLLKLVFPIARGKLAKFITRFHSLHTWEETNCSLLEETGVWSKHCSARWNLSCCINSILS